MAKTDAGRLLYKNIYLSLYCKGLKRVTPGLRVRGSWRPNRNCNILTLTLMAVTLCLSCSPDAQPKVHSAGWWLSLLHLISNSSGPQTPSGFPRAPSARCGFPYHTRLTPTGTRTGTWLLSWLSYVIVQRPLDRPLDLWNRMFNRHQAEITVMKFRGHSLPVHQSMRVSWALPCPISSANFRPSNLLS